LENYRHILKHLKTGKKKKKDLTTPKERDAREGCGPNSF